MSRTKGTYTLTSNIEPKVGAPLDARTVVNLKTDLTANGTFEYPYKGLTVFVKEENKKYTLIGTDPTVLANWSDEGTCYGKVINATLLANGWDVNNRQAVQFVGYNTNQNGVIGMPSTVTAAQKIAYQDAAIRVYSQSGTTFTFEATTVPLIDLPVTLFVTDVGSGGGGGGSGNVDDVKVNNVSVVDENGVANIELGTAATADSTTSVTQGSSDLVTSGAVYSAIDSLPKPMLMKGTLGVNGTITTLPTASASNEGYTYKVITAGTYASQEAKVGDFFTSCKPEGTSDYTWLWFPSGDESFVDTWRNVKVNGTEKLGTGIDTGSVDFIDGTNTSVEFNSTGNTIKVNSVDTKNTAGSSDISTKIFLVGASTQDADPQTYSDDEVYATNGVLTTKSVQVGGGYATIQYDSINHCIDFIVT